MENIFKVFPVSEASPIFSELPAINARVSSILLPADCKSEAAIFNPVPISAVEVENSFPSLLNLSIIVILSEASILNACIAAEISEIAVLLFTPLILE